MVSFSEGEPQVLDFQTQQHKLFPLLAAAFAYRVAALAVDGIFVAVKHDVQAGDFTRLVEVRTAVQSIDISIYFIITTVHQIE